MCLGKIEEGRTCRTKEWLTWVEGKILYISLFVCKRRKACLGKFELEGELQSEGMAESGGRRTLVCMPVHV